MSDDSSANSCVYGDFSAASPRQLVRAAQLTYSDPLAPHAPAPACSGELSTKDIIDDGDAQSGAGTEAAAAAAVVDAVAPPVASVLLRESGRGGMGKQMEANVANSGNRDDTPPTLQT